MGAVVVLVSEGAVVADGRTTAVVVLAPEELDVAKAGPGGMAPAVVLVLPTPKSGREELAKASVVAAPKTEATRMTDTRLINHSQIKLQRGLRRTRACRRGFSKRV